MVTVLGKDILQNIWLGTTYTKSLYINKYLFSLINFDK